MVLTHSIPRPRVQVQLPGVLSTGLRAAGLGTVLTMSAAAGLLTVFLWVQALGVFLGAGQAVADMTLALVVLGNLGLGAAVMGRYASHACDPMRSLVRVHISLLVVELLLWLLLGGWLEAGVMAAGRVAVTLGLPSGLYRAVVATAVLLPPCTLLGACLPLAAESCQRRWALRSGNWLGVLLVASLVGGGLAALLSGAPLIAQLGSSRLLLFAACLQALATAFLKLLALRLPRGLLAESEVHPGRHAWGRRLAREDVLAFGVGFCSLVYLAYLTRLLPWRHEPLPAVFTAIGVGALLLWALGAALSACGIRVSYSAGVRLAVLLSAGSVVFFIFDGRGGVATPADLLVFLGRRVLYFLPFACFGYLLGRAAMAGTRQWGPDFGRLCALCLLGGCVGEFCARLVFCELPMLVMILVLTLLTCALHELVREEDALPRGRRWLRWALPACAAVVAVAASWPLNLSAAVPGMRVHAGREGDIGVDGAGRVMLSGLAHGQLNRQGHHIGTREWLTAVCPVLCHRSGQIKDVCVIGVGAGTTPTTLAGLDGVRRVDAYDLHGVFRYLRARYPEDTMQVADHARLRLLDEDPRSGLALHPERRYDLVVIRPSPVRRAGSTRLHTTEFYGIINRRLKPDGLLCVSVDGTAEQAFVVRQTAAAVFPERVSFLGGRLLVLSQQRIELDQASLNGRLQRTGCLWEEIRGHPDTREPAAIQRLLDEPAVDWGAGTLVISDDRPILEHAAWLRQLIARRPVSAAHDTGRAEGPARHTRTGPHR